jgi:hypothetical protein
VLNVPGISIEIGPAILMPDERVFCVGASGHTAVYHVKTGAWFAGQVLYSNCSSDLEVYTPKGTPHHHWRPHITHVPKALRHGHSYRLRGHPLNGLSQANGYGDDAQMATNYPLVRLKYAGCKKVYFCRTFDHSTMAVATGKKLHHTHFHVPHAVPVGHYELVVVANGIHSQTVKVHVKP